MSGPTPLGEVELKRAFWLRLIWDAPNNQFRAGLNDQPDVTLTYPSAANSRAANVPAALIRIQQLPANCTVVSGGPTVGDAEITVREVRTNESAVIP